MVLTTSPHGRLARSAILLAVAFFVGLSQHVSAVSIDMVWVGNPRNTNDTTVSGSVGYNYRIGKYDVTIGQYKEFLNAVDATGTNPYGLYNPAMGSDGNVKRIQLNGTAPSGSKYSVIGSPNRPITYVSWFDAARFANWMVNGQGAGGTETGAYTLSGMTSGSTPTLNPGASFYIPMENEWYKAAYYNPTLSGSGGYYKYATQSNTAPTAVTSGSTGIGSAGSTGNFANFNAADDWNGQDGNVTTVGTNGGASAYGAFDMSGNVYEWNDLTGAAGSLRGRRGGPWDTIAFALSSSNSANTAPSNEGNSVGFRLASPVAVPEPSTYAMALAGLACGGSVVFRRRKRA